MFSIDFPQELFRYAFGGSKEKLVNLEDFERLVLRKNWDKIYRDNGVGVGVKFPMRIAPVVIFRNNFVPENGKMVNRKTLVERLRVVSSTGVVHAL